MFMKSFDFVGFIACMGKRSTGSPFFPLANHLISKFKTTKQQIVYLKGHFVTASNLFFFFFWHETKWQGLLPRCFCAQIWMIRLWIIFSLGDVWYIVDIVHSSSLLTDLTQCLQDYNFSSCTVVIANYQYQYECSIGWMPLNFD